MLTGTSLTFMPRSSTTYNGLQAVQFIVICTEQWMSKANRPPAVVGGICACLCLAILGRSSFILPALILSMAVLLAIKNKVKEASADE